MRSFQKAPDTHNQIKEGEEENVIPIEIYPQESGILFASTDFVIKELLMRRSRVVSLERVAEQTDLSQSLLYYPCVSSIPSVLFFFFNVKTALKSGFISNQCCLMMISVNIFLVLVVHAVGV